MPSAERLPNNDAGKRGARTGCGHLVRVVSWNIELGRNIELAAAEIEASEHLRAPDVLLVQEMAPDSVAELAERLGIDFRFAAPAIHPKTGTPFGNAVLSPWPMDDVVETRLPHTAIVMGQERSMASATVEVDGVEVVAHSVHLETVLLAVRRRAAQVGSVAKAVDRHRQPCIVGGDFNSASSRSLRSFDAPLHSVGFDRLTDGSMKSFRRFGRRFALDHLYVRHLTASNVGVELTPTASDHQPVWAELQVS